MDDPPGWIAPLLKAPASIPVDADRPPPCLIDGAHAAIRDPEHWRRAIEPIARKWRDFLGEITPREQSAPRVLAEETIDGGAIARILLRYLAEPGVSVDAYLLRPTARAEPRARPGVLVFHSTVDHTIRQPAGLDGPAELHVGLQLARRGYVALCPMNFLWSAGDGRRIDAAVTWLEQTHPGVTGMAKMLYDASRACDVLMGQNDVDPSRIGAFGHSLGAKEVLYLAAFDDRVKATVFSEGGIGIGYSNWEAPWYLGEAAARPGFAFDHAQLLSLVAPRAFLLIAGESADGDRSWPYIEAAAPVWKLLENPRAIGFHNHRMGHAFPPSARLLAHRWLDWSLQHGAAPIER